VNAVVYWRMSPIPIPQNSSLFPTDVTVVVPTNASNLLELVASLRSILACEPARVILVTAEGLVEKVKRIFKEHDVNTNIVEVISIKKLNKRSQMVAALKIIRTTVTVFADDDVIWPSQYLTYLLAPFEDTKVGAVGTRQRVRRQETSTLIHFLGTSYLERRSFMTCAFNAIDGSVSTLSGRTAAYRTNILKNEPFYHAFINSNWRGHLLNTDDDKFLTRWVFSHDWKIRIQPDERAILLTSLEETYTGYGHQCLRWARAHWRGNLVVMTKETYWFKQHWWSFYAVYMASFQTPALIVDGFLLWLLYHALEGCDDLQIIGLMYLALWIAFTKLVKLFPHFMRHPEDLRFVPASILFSYVHGIINLWALFTLHVTKWGSRNVESPVVEIDLE